MPTASQNAVGGTGQDTPSSEIDSAVSTPTLRNAATAAPGEKVASLESADESVRAYDEDEIVHTVPCSCYGWSRQRVRLCLCGSASSAIVLVVRLLLDWYSGTTYVIHKRDRATGRFPTQFLDGAAGVMYTSFLGLILDDLIALGTGKYKKCA